MNGDEFLDRLKKGKRLYGTAVLSASPLWPSAVKRAGVDFVFIDTEHIALDRTTLAQMCLAYRGCGLPPLVYVLLLPIRMRPVKFSMEEHREFLLHISNRQSRLENWLAQRSCVR